MTDSSLRKSGELTLKELERYEVVYLPEEDNDR